MKLITLYMTLLNQKKIKTISEETIKVIGYSVVGSFKGFDVISEV